MHLSVEQKLLAFAALAICAMLSVGGAGYYGQVEQAQTLEEMSTKLSALRNHLEADMMHDALRGDVLYALYSASHDDTGRKQGIDADLEEHLSIFKKKIADSEGLELPQAIKAAIAAVVPALGAYEAAARSIVDLSFSDLDRAKAQLPAFQEAFGLLESDMEALSTLIENDATSAETQAVATAQRSRSMMLGIIVAATIAFLLLSLAVIRSISGPLAKLHTAIESVRNNNAIAERITGFTADFLAIQISFNGVLDALAEQRREEQRRAEAALRVQHALSAATTNVVLTDAQSQVIFANESARNMFQEAAADIRNSLPGFSAEKIVGRDLGQFFSDPEMARSVENSTEPRENEVALGGHTYRVTSTVVEDDAGDRLGIVCEWLDLTEQREAERQIQEVLDAAIAGRLQTRLDASCFRGFMHTLAQSVNAMLDAITNPFQEVKEVIAGLACGDLARRMHGTYDGDFAVLHEAVESSTRNLVDMVGRIHDSSNTISASAGEISHGTQDLSDRTQEQAAALEETSSSLHSLTGRSSENAASARSANELAQSARQKAEQGGKIIADAVTAMSEINSASKRIADIISVIDSIAFQTNLLALNAAVEAARAGEQGRGFAVVASEVRNLAQSSASAAREIKDLINDSVEKVNHGSNLVNASGDTLRELVESVVNVGAIIAAITTATEEQMVGFKEVSQAVHQLNDVTQQNSALVEQTASASALMADESRTLRDLIAFFKTGQDTDKPAQHTNLRVITN